MYPLSERMYNGYIRGRSRCIPMGGRRVSWRGRKRAYSVTLELEESRSRTEGMSVAAMLPSLICLRVLRFSRHCWTAVARLSHPSLLRAPLAC